jgi:putative endonuclease
MFIVYVLHAKAFDKIYIGYTSNLVERLKSHNELGHKGWTLKFRPWEVIYKEEYQDKFAAMKREKQLKSFQGRLWIRQELLKSWTHIRRLADGGSNPPFATKENLGLILRPFFMFIVYVLHSKAFDKIYIGYTSNLVERLKSHNELGHKGWTLKFRPWEVIHKEEYQDKLPAMQREKQLKSFQGRLWIQQELLKSWTHIRWLADGGSNPPPNQGDLTILH